MMLAPDSKHLALISKIPQHPKPHLILVEIESGKIVHRFWRTPFSLSVSCSLLTASS